MNDAMDKMRNAAWVHLRHPVTGDAPDDDAIEAAIAAALAAAPTVEGYVLCEGHHVAPTGHCYIHGARFCAYRDCGPCPGPFQDLIARPSTENTP
jgi:hypothetical protein